MSFTRTALVVALTLASVAAAAAAQAATAWDEAVEGDLSGNGLAPTVLQLVEGHNEVRGTMGNDGQGIDRDYFSFSVPVGTVLNALVLLANSTVSGSASFIALQSGPQITVSPTGAGAEALLGFAHYGGDQIGTDLLPSIVFGFDGALPAGTYAVWIQETGGQVAYGFDYQVSSIPEPGPASLMLGGLLLLAARSVRPSPDRAPGLDRR